LVYIKRVDLRGFKTFGKKATVHLDRGLTIVTGPNGSGKSNILDSVKFALGELSPKELRGETIGDLIHKGAQAATTRSAYVAVQFDNHDRRIPVDAEAVTISREFRRGGEGIYRMNGRKISRKQLTDILSSADIQVSSYNIVPQHAITRLAEVTTEERRQIIEDMIGIGVYDVKKTSAEAELQKADVNLQVASAKIEEVRLRVESLEKERNDFLKFTQIKNDLNELQAKAISYKINKSKQHATELEEKIAENQEQIQELKANRDALIQRKSTLESEKRQFEDQVAEKGSTRLIEIQRTMGDVSAAIARLEAQANSIESNDKTLRQQKANLEHHSSEIIDKIDASRNELRDLETRRASLLEIIEAKQAGIDESLKTLANFRDNLGERNKEAEEIENTLSSLTNRLLRFDAQIKASTTKIELFTNHLSTLNSRKEEYQSTLETIGNRLNELEMVRKEEEERANNADNKAAEYAKLKELGSKEVVNANEVIKRAGLALAEIESQRDMAQNIAADDKALCLIEDMAGAGTVAGVYGRLSEIIKVKNGYVKPVEAAAAGWLKAIVVRDMETAISCIEVLKKTKVGRVKLIPLSGLANPQRIQTLNQSEEIIGPIVDQLEFDDNFRSAVDYVFGDTVLTTNQKSAFILSLEGIRAVAATGDLYEPGGGMETGFFRQPLDLSKLLLNSQTVAELRNTLLSLEKMATKANDEIVRLEQEVVDQAKNKTQSLNLISLTQREITTFKENLERATRVVEETAGRMEQLSREITTERVVLEACNYAKEKIQTGPLTDCQRTHDSLKIHSQSAELLEKENEHSRLGNEFTELGRQRIEIESRIQALKSTIEILEPTNDQAKSQAVSIDSQLQHLAEDLPAVRAKIVEFEEQLKQVHGQRDQISHELVGVKEKREGYNTQITKLDKEITSILEDLDLVNGKSADLTASQKHQQMQIDFHMTELKEIGYTDVIQVADDEIESIEKTIPALKKELAAIGGINELAASQYEEVKENYKHLATRIYDLEKEKMSIVKFMNELDQQKLEAFMKAFNQVSDSFSEIFTTVTSGVGRLFLEKPETPFEGGADIKLQFAGKTLMSIGSASGGEKSVGTVCFILALQAIHPMPFYMMDEIDAHLDVVNSQKLAELLKSKSKGSQFIIVSLKDVTIARADTVYGVFIQDGVSQVVSLPMQGIRAVGRAN
jgi:chromosome segregation protein